MPNIAALLKSEISRLARREIRQQVTPLRKIAATQRRDIAALKRAIETLERRVKSLAKAKPVHGEARTATDATSTRFVAKGLVSLRKRLGLSATQFAQLMGVSAQSIYNWEHKLASPRKEQVAGIVALRSIGKREAHQRLEALPHPRKKASGPSRRKRSRASRSAAGRV
jgi:DNA-binding transcriptional regulator YiaG